jgi:hypothetical protein
MFMFMSLGWDCVSELRPQTGVRYTDDKWVWRTTLKIQLLASSSWRGGGNILERQKGLWSTEAKECGIVLRVHGIGVVIAVS